MRISDWSSDVCSSDLGHYTVDIPQLFEFNAIAVASDGITTQHGVWTAPWEWFAPWKSIDGFQVEANTTGSMKTLVEGRSEERRVGKECFRTCSSRWSPDH